MSQSTRGRLRASARVTTLLTLLERLARRGASGEVHVAADGTRSLHLACPESNESVAAIAIWTVFREAAEHGCIVSSDGIVWTLSRPGRVMLRRLKSQGAGEIAREAAPRLPEHAPPARFDAAESPLSWLRRRRDRSGEPMISALQYDAGERLRSDFTFAGLTPRVTVNWLSTGGSGKSGSGIGVELADNVVAAGQRVQHALRAVGPVSASVLIDVCGHLKGLEEIERMRGWPARSGKIVLGLALTELARHYGLPGADAGAEHVGRRLRHWGAEDYRPEVRPLDRS